MPEVALLDREADADHNRCVLTFVGPPAAVAEAAFRGVQKAVELIDLTRHQGAHPRIGAADVVPFIPIEGVTLEECVRLAEQLGQRIWDKLRVPVYFYEAAARRPERVNLENIRRGQFEALVREMGTVPERAPDCGEAVCHPTAGAVVVGARKFLIAYNINLGTPDVAIAKKIATTIRFSSGGFRYVKSMGVDAGLAQPGAGLHQPHRFRADAHAPGVRNRAPRSRAVRRAGGGQRNRRADSPAKPSRCRPNISCASRISGRSWCWKTASPRRLAARGGLPEFLDALAAPTATPGGGSAAAAAAAMAAALGSMVTRLAKPGPGRVRRRPPFLHRSRGPRRRSVPPGDGRLPAPQDRSADRTSRKPCTARPRCRSKCWNAPRRMRARLEALDVPAKFGSDLAVAKALAAAACTGALENVRINLESIADAEFKSAAGARVERAASPADTRSRP